jgi:taurine dioxygenase
MMGMSDAKALVRMQELSAVVIQPAGMSRHQGQVGDLLMWDNCAVQHKATFDYDLPLRRLMYRTTVRGTAPF